MMRHVVLATFIAIVLAGVPAQAVVTNSITYQITSDHCTGGCQPGNPGDSMGTITLTQGTNTVAISILLNAGFYFVNTGLQETIDFNLINTPTITVTNFSNSVFSLANVGGVANQRTATDADGFQFDGLGVFEYAIKQNTAQGGAGKQAGNLSFNVNASGISINDFATFGTAPGTSISFFGFDVLSPTGATGAIDAGGTVVPEPSAVVLFGTVLLGVGVWLRKRVGVNV